MTLGFFKSLKYDAPPSYAVPYVYNMQVRRGAGIMATTRRVGKELSRKIYMFMTSSDPNQIIKWKPPSLPTKFSAIFSRLWLCVAFFWVYYLLSCTLCVVRCNKLYIVCSEVQYSFKLSWWSVLSCSSFYLLDSTVLFQVQFKSSSGGLYAFHCQYSIKSNYPNLNEDQLNFRCTIVNIRSSLILQSQLDIWTNSTFKSPISLQKCRRPFCWLTHDNHQSR